MYNIYIPAVCCHAWRPPINRSLFWDTVTHYSAGHNHLIIKINLRPQKGVWNDCLNVLGCSQIDSCWIWFCMPIYWLMCDLVWLLGRLSRLIVLGDGSWVGRPGSRGNHKEFNFDLISGRRYLWFASSCQFQLSCEWALHFCLDN